MITLSQLSIINRYIQRIPPQVMFLIFKILIKIKALKRNAYNAF